MDKFAYNLAQVMQKQSFHSLNKAKLKDRKTISIRERLRRLAERRGEPVESVGTYKSASNKPFRNRVEVFATNKSGKFYGGLYPDGYFGGFGGGIDDGEDLVEAAKREFKEECGHSLLNATVVPIEPVEVKWTHTPKTEEEKSRHKKYQGSRTYIVTGTVGERKTKNTDTHKLSDVKYREAKEVLGLINDKDKLGKRRKLAIEMISKAEPPIVKQANPLRMLASVGRLMKSKPRVPVKLPANISSRKLLYTPPIALGAYFGADAIRTAEIKKKENDRKRETQNAVSQLNQIRNGNIF